MSAPNENTGSKAPIDWDRYEYHLAQWQIDAWSRHEGPGLPINIEPYRYTEVNAVPYARYLELVRLAAERLDMHLAYWTTHIAFFQQPTRTIAATIDAAFRANATLAELKTMIVHHVRYTLGWRVHALLGIHAGDRDTFFAFDRLSSRALADSPSTARHAAMERQAILDDPFTKAVQEQEQLMARDESAMLERVRTWAHVVEGLRLGLTDPEVVPADRFPAKEKTLRFMRQLRIHGMDPEDPMEMQTARGDGEVVGIDIG